MLSSCLARVRTARAVSHVHLIGPTAQQTAPSSLQMCVRHAGNRAVRKSDEKRAKSEPDMIYSEDAENQFYEFQRDSYSSSNVRRKKLEIFLNFVSTKDDLLLIRDAMTTQIRANLKISPKTTDLIASACIRVPPHGLAHAMKWFTYVHSSDKMASMSASPDLVRLNPESYTIRRLMKALVKEGQYENVFKLFHHWDNKLDLAHDVYHVVFSMAKEDKTYVDRSYDLFKRMRQIGPIPTKLDYTLLASAAMRHNDNKTASEIMSLYRTDAYPESKESIQLREEVTTALRAAQ
eukprot:CFRG2446T1